MSYSKVMARCIWLIVSTFYAYQYILRVMPNIISTNIMQQFNIDAAVFGQFSGVYYLGYCIMHIPIAIMLDRYGPKIIISICMLCTVFGILPIIFADHWLYPIIGRFFIGAGSSAAILGVFKVIRIVFIEKHFARMLSFSVTLGLIGAIYGNAPIHYLYEIYGYQVVVQIIAVLGVILASTAYILIPNVPVIQNVGIISSLKYIFTNSRVLSVCILAGCMVGPLEGFADAWGSQFLKEVYNYDMSKAHYIISMIYLGMCCAPILSLIGEKTDSYIGTIVGAGIIMTATFIILVTQQFNMQAMILSFFVIGICCAYQILAIYKASTYVPEHMISLTTAVANMIIMGFGYIFHSVIGIIVKQYNDLGLDKAYIYGVSIIPFMLLIGIIGFSTLSYRERKYQ